MSLSRGTLIGSFLAAAAAIHPAHAAGKVLRIGISTSLNTLDPMMVTTGDEYIYANLAFNGLARMREDLVVEPDLAESWTFSDGQAKRPLPRSRTGPLHRSSRPGMEPAARYADALFGAGTTRQHCIDAYADIKGHMARNARTPDTLKVLPGISIFVGRNAAEAEAFYATSKVLPLDGPLPTESRKRRWAAALRRYVIDFAKRDNLSIRQTYQRTPPALGGPVFKGSPSQVADEMEDWWRSKAGDGFAIMMPVQPRGIATSST